MISPSQPDKQSPLKNLDAWGEDLPRRYPEPASEETCCASTDSQKKNEAFRDYGAKVRPSVKEFYRLNHRNQTVDFVKKKHDLYLGLEHGKKSIWEGLEYLNTLVDESDPDTELSQLSHLLQTSEAIRDDSQPRWFILAGLLHDLGKVLCLYGEPQWAVVGDTFPVGCRFSDRIIFPEFFAENPDSNVAEYQTRLGIYEEGCGFCNILMSWGHDEYIYQVTKDYLPIEARYMLRFHSFYSAHREHEYEYLMNDQDRENFKWVHTFNKYDLYTKSDKVPNVEELRPYYEELIAEFFPVTVAF